MAELKALFLSRGDCTSATKVDMMSAFRSCHARGFSEVVAGACVLDEELCELICARYPVEVFAVSPVFPRIAQFVASQLETARRTSTVQYLVCALTARRMYNHAMHVLFLSEKIPLGLRVHSAGAALLHPYLRQTLDYNADDAESEDRMFHLAKSALRLFESDCVAVPPVDLGCIIIPC